MITLFYKLRTFETLPEDRLDKKSKFAIYLNDNFIGLVNSPSHDGARLLLKLGFDPETLMTTQAQDSQHPSWKPQKLRQWAKLTVKERDSTGLALEPFSQFPGVGVLPGVSPLCDTTYLNRTTPLYAAPVGVL